MSRTARRPGDEYDITLLDLIAPEAYAEFRKSDVPANWGENEFLALLDAAIHPKHLAFKPPGREQNKPELYFEGLEQSNLGVVIRFGSLWAAHPDLVLKLLQRFRRVLKKWYKSPERQLAMQVAILEGARNLLTPEQKAELTHLDCFWDEKKEAVAESANVTPKVIDHVRDRVRKAKPFKFPPKQEATKGI